MAEQQKVQLLDLDPLVERPFIRFGGAEYDVRTPEEFGLLDYQRLKRNGQRLIDLFHREQLTPDEEKELAGMLDRICRDVLIADDDVHARLSDGQRIKIISAFMGLRPAPPQAAGAETNPTTSTGASSSPG